MLLVLAPVLAVAEMLQRLQMLELLLKLVPVVLKLVQVMVVLELLGRLVLASVLAVAVVTELLRQLLMLGVPGAVAEAGDGTHMRGTIRGCLRDVGLDRRRLFLYCRLCSFSKSDCWHPRVFEIPSPVPRGLQDVKTMSLEAAAANAE